MLCLLLCVCVCVCQKSVWPAQRLAPKVRGGPTKPRNIRQQLKKCQNSHHKPTRTFVGRDFFSSWVQRAGRVVQQTETSRCQNCGPADWPRSASIPSLNFSTLTCSYRTVRYNVTRCDGQEGSKARCQLLTGRQCGSFPRSTGDYQLDDDFSDCFFFGFGGEVENKQNHQCPFQ
jgi:hypothetical protein